MSFLKNLVIIFFDIIVFFLAILIWNWYYNVPNKFMKAIFFTIYLSIIFFIYKFLFEWAWNKRMI